MYSKKKGEKMSPFIKVLIVIITIPLSITFLARAYWIMFYQLKKKTTLIPLSPRNFYNTGWGALFFLILGLSAPSPCVEILKNFEGLIIISFLRSTARPRVSNPGPRLADVAGTDTNIITLLPLNSWQTILRG